MKTILSKVAVALCVTVLLSAPWAMFLGAEGMELFWASMFCGVVLFFTAKREFLSSPWSVVIGMVLSWWLLRTGLHLLPEDNALRGGSLHLGVSLGDMIRVRNFSFISTVGFFLVRELLEGRDESEGNKRQSTRRYRALKMPQGFPRR